MMNNPWFSIWVRPKATIQAIVAQNPNRSLWLLAAIYGFPSILNLFQTMSLGNGVGLFPLLFLAVILSPFWGYLAFSIWSAVVLWTGKWLKGAGHFAAVRAAYSWSCVPFIFTVFFWICLLVLFGPQLFVYFPEQYAMADSQAALMFFILIAKVVLAIWSLVIYLNALAAVQKFSVLRSIGNVVIAGALLSIVFGTIWFLLMSMMGR